MLNNDGAHSSILSYSAQAGDAVQYLIFWRLAVAESGAKHHVANGKKPELHAIMCKSLCSIVIHSLRLVCMGLSQSSASTSSNTLKGQGLCVTHKTDLCKISRIQVHTRAQKLHGLLCPELPQQPPNPALPLLLAHRLLCFSGSCHTPVWDPFFLAASDPELLHLLPCSQKSLQQDIPCGDRHCVVCSHMQW